MDVDKMLGALRQAGFLPDQLLAGEPMSRHTTMRVGGSADLLALPASDDQVISALELARVLNVPTLVMGGGSNLIVRDGGVRGLVILLGERMADISEKGGVIVAQAGARLAQLSAAAQRFSLTGLEFAAGIPGTVGGGVAMNAGAYGGELKDALLWADVLVGGAVERMDVSHLDMGYRSSRVNKMGGVVLRAAFALRPGDRDQIAGTVAELAARRRDKQPLNLPSAGSTFKRPAGQFAGPLIEGAGLKGYAIGGAQVSEKHAGFVVNRGGATARDVLDLIEHVKARVYECSGVMLEMEVRVVGEG